MPAGRDGLHRFYAAEVSYFSGKVRPALRYKRVPFVELLATPAAYRAVIRARTGLTLIPVVVTPEDETLQDSSDILDALEARFPDPPLYPPTALQRIAGYLVELYVDEFLLLPALHYRWSFPESEAKARADFAATTGEPTGTNRLADAIKRFTGLIGVTPETIPAIEAHTTELLALLSDHLARHPYLLGDRPSLADCALMGPLYAHLYQDAVPARLLRETAPRVCHWIERMNHPDPDGFGAWLPDEALPESVHALLRLIGHDAVPLILDSARAFDAWADANPGTAEELPRAIGTHPTTLRGTALERLTTPYTLWMVQRCQAVYRAVPGPSRAAVDRAIAGTGCEALFRHAPRHRVVCRPFKLFLEEDIA